MNIKAAIFDMDGTLVDSLFFWEPFWRDLGARFLGKENYVPPKELDQGIRTMTFTEAMAYIREPLGITASAEELVAFGTENLADFYRTQVGPKAGVLAFLDHLKARGVRMCVASATDKKYLPIALEACGLSSYFETVLSCSELGVGKDQPDIYLKAMELLGTAPADTCIFEDSFVALETAKRIGCHTVGVFDKNNYGQERLRAASEIYLGEGEGFDTLIPRVK